MIFSIAGGKKRYETAESVQEIIDEIKEDSNKIIEINLCDNVFLVEAAMPLFKTIKEVKHLNKLILSRVFSALPRDIMMKSFEAVISNINPKQLVYLDLSENALSCDFPDFFVEFLINLDNLRVLKVQNCGFGTIGGNKLASILKRIVNKSNLMVLDFSSNKLTSSAANLGETFSEFKYLEEVYIQYNNVDRESMFHFLKSFDDHSLVKLDLRDNLIDERGCKLLGEFFVSWDLEDLRIGDCLIRDDGLKAFISNANLKSNLLMCQGGFTFERTMTLDISFNEITEEGLEGLEDFLEAFKVKKLHIEGNDFETCEKIIETVRKHDGVVIFEEEDSNEDEDKLLLEEKIANL